MDLHAVLLFLHLLLFVFWLGTDVGVFTLALALKNPRYSVAQRLLLMRISLAIDLLPRVAFALIAVIGLHLATSLGLVSPPAWLLPLAWLIGIAWICAEFFAFKHMGKPVATRLYIFTGSIMLGECLVFLGFGLSSLLRGWPVDTPWLAWKLFLFGLVFLVSVMMAVFYAPLEGIFNRMKHEGSTPAMESRVRTQVNRGAVFTVMLFMLLAAMAWLGQAKPG